MSDEVNQLIQAYKKISTNNDELINQATKEINALISDPSIIDSLLYIIQNNDDNFCKMQAAISLKRVVLSFSEHFADEDMQGLIQIILKCLSNENFEIIQNVLLDIVYALLSEKTIPIIISFIQNSIKYSLNAKLIIILPDSYLQQLLPFLEPLITKLLDSDINGILLGFRIRNYIDQDFFHQIFQKSIEMSIQFSDKINDLKKIIGAINNNIKYIEDKSSILELYLPLIGSNESDISFESQLQYSYVVSNIIKSIEITDTQTMFSILQKYFDLYAMIEENHDVFDFVETFATNIEFLEYFISKLQESISSEKELNAFLLCLSHCFSKNMNINTNFKYINDIATFLSKVVLHPSKSVRTTAGIVIQNFVMELKEYISDVCIILINSMIDSLNIESNNDIIEALSHIFNYSSYDNMDSQDEKEHFNQMFDKAFSYFLPKIQNNENMQIVFPSFVALCATNKVKSLEHFDQIFEINNTILESEDSEIECIQNFAVNGLENLAIICSDKFSDKIPELISYFTHLLEKNDDNSELVMEILSAIGSFKSKFKSQFDFSSLIPLLTKIVENYDESSSLALSAICSILDEYMDEIDLSDMIQDILQYFQQLSNKINEQIYLNKSILNLLRAMTLFVNYIEELSHSGDKIKSKSDLFDSVFNWVVIILNNTEDNYIISEGISVLIEMVGDYSFDQSSLFPLIEKFFTKEYDEDFFPTFTYFLKRLISNGANFDSLIPSLFEMANSSKNKETCDFGLQILGQIAESQSGECVDENFIKKLIECSLKNIHDFESSSAVYVINQIVNGCSKMPNFNEFFDSEQLMSILLEYIQEEKCLTSYLEFVDNCVTAFASIVIHVVGDNVPFDSYLKIVLDKMPARYETTENFEMMHFLLWVGNKTDFNPPDLFLAVLVRFFSNKMDDDVVGFIANNADLIQTLKAKVLLLMERVDKADAFIAQICQNDQLKLSNFQKNIECE